MGHGEPKGEEQMTQTDVLFVILGISFQCALVAVFFLGRGK